MIRSTLATRRGSTGTSSPTTDSCTTFITEPTFCST
jgi:hypothetical protein